MSILGDAIGRSRGGAGSEPPSANGAPGVGGAVAATRVAAAPVSAPERAGGTPAPSGPPAHDGRSELRRRRDALAEQVTELHWDLGGLTYEMAIRDHFRLDVLVRRAAVLQERDAELAEVERLLALEESASAGNCPACRAPHSRGAVYCWQCGATLMERAPSASAPRGGGGGGDGAHDGSTAVMDALLSADAADSDGTRPSRAGSLAEE